MAGCVVAIVLGWTLLLERVRYERDEVIEDALRHTSNLALAFEEQTARTLESADQVLRFVKFEYEQWGLRVSPGQIFKAGIADPAFVSFVGTADDTGALLFHADEHEFAIDISDREYFRYHRDHADDTVRIGQLLVGRVSGVVEIPLTRRLNKPDGSFAGVAVVGVPAAYFASFYRRLDLGTAGLVQLVHRDGTLLTRREGLGQTSGLDMSDSILLRNAATSRIGTFVSRGRRDGERRYQSYRALEQYPLVVSVGIPSKEVIGPADRRARNYFIGGIAATAAVLLFAAAMLAAQRRSLRTHEALAASEARFRSLTELSSDFYWETDAEHRLTLRGSGGKPSSVQALQDGRQIGLRRWEMSYLSPGEAQWNRHRATLDAHQPFRDFEISRAGDGGAERHISLSGDPIFDAAGLFCGYRGVGKDITKRKRAVMELRAQLDELRRFQKVTLEREFRIQELKAELRELKARAA